MTTPLLQPDVAQGLTSAVTRAASEALRCKTMSGGADEQMHRQLRLELRACFEEALSNLSSAFNAETTLPGRLSNELWCIVWSFLPMAALVRATHVCRRWRNVALGCAHLWCWVEYDSDVHYDDCDCHLDPFFFGRSRCEDGPGSSNLGAVKLFLSRSGTTLPISLGITISGEYSSRDELRLFTDAVKPYVDRLAMIRFTAPHDEEACSLFLKRFDCLPALHTLHSSCSSISTSPRKSAGFLSRPLRLPALRKLQLIGALDSRGIMPDQLPTLEALEVGSSRMEPRDILEFLKVSTALRQLHVTSPSPLREQPQEALDLARDLAAGRCMSVTVGGLSAESEAPFLAVFDGAQHRSICLAYAEGQGSLSVAGARILGHLDRVAELAVYHRTEQATALIVAARAPDGKARTLEFLTRPGDAAVQIHGVWTHLPTPPDAMRVDARVWAGLRLPVQVLANVKRLDILFDSPEDLNVLASPGAFAVLEELRLCGEIIKGSFPRVAAETVLSFLQAVTVPGVVKNLVLSRIEVTGAVVSLDRAVPNVVVQPV